MRRVRRYSAILSLREVCLLSISTCMQSHPMPKLVCAHSSFKRINSGTVGLFGPWITWTMAHLSCSQLQLTRKTGLHISTFQGPESKASIHSTHLKLSRV